LSKDIDPATVSPNTVKVTCDGKAFAGAPTVMPLQHTFVFKPSEQLPKRSGFHHLPGAGRDG